MGKGGSVISSERGDEEPLNSGAIDELALYRAERRVLDHQCKLHRWARTEPQKRFGADDFVVLVHGTQSDAETLRAEIGELLGQELKMTLSAEKTHITPIDAGGAGATAVRSCSPSRPNKRWPG
ncbi:hypothetical protein [Pseudonocardia sp. GCM10023141]|uniref:hypothetical protein n=1 Tax=Pseudonocardia sp. GCM10023141 TaxID=3252653 RepID=UPI00361A3508